MSTLGVEFFLGDIDILINQAKEGAAYVNATATDGLTRMQNISEELNKVNISTQDSNLNNLLDGVNKTCESTWFFFPDYWVNIINIFLVIPSCFHLPILLAFWNIA